MQQSIPMQAQPKQKQSWLWPSWRSKKDASAASSIPTTSAAPAAPITTQSQLAQALPVAHEPTNFYERAIEWTHHADKIINLVLGYLLAIASVLGFMDVLSNGQVLNQVPFMFYVWLGIMGLGVDFQILLVVGRIPETIRTPGKAWQKWIIFSFHIVFLAFLCVMSVATSAIFTQHRDMPVVAVMDAAHHLTTRVSTIGDAMGVLNIDPIWFVYGRAALATLLLVLMAVDRTMERWRMQLGTDASAIRNAAAADATTTVRAGLASTQQEQQIVPLQAKDMTAFLQAITDMNQQMLQAQASTQAQTLAAIKTIQSQQSTMLQQLANNATRDQETEPLEAILKSAASPRKRSTKAKTTKSTAPLKEVEA